MPKKPDDPVYLTVKAVLARLRTLCADSTQKEVARDLGVSPSYLGDVLSGHREPGDKIASALGLERVTRYVETGRTS